jgi:hypothetical protein
LELRARLAVDGFLVLHNRDALVTENDTDGHRRKVTVDPHFWMNFSNIRQKEKPNHCAG